MFYFILQNTEILNMSVYRDFAVRNTPPLTNVYACKFFFLVITYCSSFCTHK